MILGKSDAISPYTHKLHHRIIHCRDSIAPLEKQPDQQRVVPALQQRSLKEE